MWIAEKPKYDLVILFTLLKQNKRENKTEEYCIL